MKVSLEWLADFLPGPLDAEAAAEALTGGGLPVEGIERSAADTVLDVEVTSNRGDCLSHLGVARELAALLDRPLSERAMELSRPAPSDDIPPPVDVRIDDPELCPHYTARLIRGVKIGPSPAWVARRLEAAGLRAINNVVDVTNYVMLEMGQPLHAFDHDTLEGGRIVVRQAREGESITAIDGRMRALAPPMLAICDAGRPVALAGVMGGLHTEVSPRTVNVLLEAARFDPLSIRRTSRALAMKSDSSYRFERGIDPCLPQRASLRAARMIVELAGGRIIGGMAEAGASGWSARTLSLRLKKLREHLGMDVPADAAMECLRRLGLEPALRDDRIECSIPSWRMDLRIEVDLVEEVARVMGYDRIPVRDEISIRLTPPQRDDVTCDTIRAALVACGYYEAITVGFVSDVLRDDFTPREAHALYRADPIVRRDNAHLRPSLLPGLLEAVRHNETVGTPGAMLFEIGSTFWADAAGRCVELRRLGIIGGDDVRGLRGAVETLLAKLDADRPVRVVPDEARPGFAPGACGRIEWGGRPVGYMGLVRGDVAGKLSMKHAPPAAELELPPLLEGAQHVPQLHPLPRFPAVRRDLSLVVAEAVRYERIEAVLRGLNLPDLEAVEYVTTFRGGPLEKGTKSVTVSLVFRSAQRTLASEEVDAAVARAVEAAGRELGATLRT